MIDGAPYPPAKNLFISGARQNRFYAGIFHPIDKKFEIYFEIVGPEKKKKIKQKCARLLLEFLQHHQPKRNYTKRKSPSLRKFKLKRLLKFREKKQLEQKCMDLIKESILKKGENNFINANRNVQPGLPSFAINIKTGSMLIISKAKFKGKEDIEKVQNQFYSTRNRLRAENIELTPEAFNFDFNTIDYKIDSVGLALSKKNIYVKNDVRYKIQQLACIKTDKSFDVN